MRRIYLTLNVNEVRRLTPAFRNVAFRHLKGFSRLEGVAMRYGIRANGVGICPVFPALKCTALPKVRCERASGSFGRCLDGRTNLTTEI
jgi:hypothetical protein